MAEPTSDELLAAVDAHEARHRAAESRSLSNDERSALADALEPRGALSFKQACYSREGYEQMFAESFPPHLISALRKLALSIVSVGHA
jgi:hypothetical protein